MSITTFQWSATHDTRERKKRETKESNQRKIRDKKEREITQNNFVVYRFKIIEKEKGIFLFNYFSFVLYFLYFVFSSFIFAIDFKV